MITSKNTSKFYGSTEDITVQWTEITPYSYILMADFLKKKKKTQKNPKQQQQKQNNKKNKTTTKKKHTKKQYQTNNICIDKAQSFPIARLSYICIVK